MSSSEVFLIYAFEVAPGGGDGEPFVFHPSCTFPCHTRLQIARGWLFNAEPIILERLLFVSDEGKPV